MIFSTCLRTTLKQRSNLRLSAAKTVRLVLAILCFVTMAESVSAQVQVTAIWINGTALRDYEKANEVDCTHDDWSQEKVYVGMHLKPWDTISSPKGTAYIELKAKNGDMLKLWSDFSFLINPADPHFIIEGSKGNGECQCPGGSKTYGEAAIVVIGTEYSVSFQRTPRGLREEYTVLEGEIEVRADDPEPQASPSQKTARVASGQKVLVSGRRLPSRLLRATAEDISQSASVYAAINTAKAAMKNQIDSKEVYLNFRKRYEAVFTDPKNADNRIQLAVDQVNLDVSDDAIYQAQKAEKFVPAQQNTTRSLIAVTKAVAYEQKGDKELAGKEIEKAQALNPSILEEDNLRLYRFNDKTRTQIRQVKFRPISEDRGADPAGGAWPMPAKLTSLQKQMFDLINARRFKEASSVISERFVGGDDTAIMAYLLAIVSYELKDPAVAYTAAQMAMDKSRKDQSLSKDVYAAAQKIYDATRPR